MLPEYTFVPQYYCGDNLNLALSKNNLSTATIIEAVYFNITEIGSDTPLYGFDSKVATDFAQGTRLVQGTFAVPAGELPQWVLTSEKWRALGSLYVEPTNKDWPILQLKSVRVQGVHQTMQPDGSPILHTVSFIAVRKEVPLRFDQTVEAEVDPPEVQDLEMKVFYAAASDTSGSTHWLLGTPTLTSVNYPAILSELFQFPSFFITSAAVATPVKQDYGLDRHITEYLNNTFLNGLQDYYTEGLLLLEVIFNQRPGNSSVYILIPSTATDPITGDSIPSFSYHKLSTTLRYHFTSLRDGTVPTEVREEAVFKDQVIEYFDGMKNYNTWFFERDANEKPRNWKEAWEMING